MVEADVVLVKTDDLPRLLILGRDHKLVELQDQFLGEQEEIALECVFKVPKQYKTNRQLAYLFGVLAPKWKKLLNDMGNNFRSKEKAIEYAKLIYDFTESVTNHKNGKIIHTPLSLSDASKEQVSEFIENIFLELIGCGVEVMTSEEYFRKNSKWN